MESQGAENEHNAEIVLGMDKGNARGAKLFEDQGEEQNEEPITDNDKPNNQDESNDKDIRREEEIERRRTHFVVHTGNEYGRGKRVKKKKSFTFLQTKYSSLDKSQKEDFLRFALDEYQLSQKTNAIERYVTGHIFTQLSAKQGIRRYGRMAELKLLAEFKQLLEYKTFHGRNPKEFSFEQKKKAANMINLIEEKVNRGHTRDNPVIKGRSVFNGRVQRGLYSKEDTASPTISQDAFFYELSRRNREEKNCHNRH